MSIVEFCAPNLPTMAIAKKLMEGKLQDERLIALLSHHTKLFS